MRTVHLTLAAVASFSVLLRTGMAAAQSCNVSNVTPMDFGSYTLMSPSPVDSVGELTIDCGAPTPVRIIMGRGISGCQIPRELRSGASWLSYNLFSDAARTVIWGDGTEGTQTFIGTAPGAVPLRLSIFGRIFARQGVPAGTYIDRITVVIIF